MDLGRWPIGTKLLRIFLIFINISQLLLIVQNITKHQFRERNITSIFNKLKYTYLKAVKKSYKTKYEKK